MKESIEELITMIGLEKEPRVKDFLRLKLNIAIDISNRKKLSDAMRDIYLAQHPEAV